MKLPNADRAYVDLGKLTEYALNPEHPLGQHKALVFKTVLGIGREHAASLRLHLLDIARTLEAEPQESSPFGQRYVIDFELTTEAGTGRVRSAWIVRTDEDFPRLTSCYVLQSKREES
jgi:hypothetical protein